MSFWDLRAEHSQQGLCHWQAESVEAGGFPESNAAGEEKN
jgi:hypothetical protein